MWGYFKMELIFSLNNINIGTDKYFLLKKDLELNVTFLK